MAEAIKRTRVKITVSVEPVTGSDEFVEIASHIEPIARGTSLKRLEILAFSESGTASSTDRLEPFLLDGIDW